MVSKHFLTATLLGTALLFLGADASLYARGGGGGGGGGHGGGGGGHGGGGFGGGGRGGYGGGGYGRGGFGGGYGGYGYGGYGGYGYGGYGGGFYGGGLFYGDYSTGGGYPGYFAPYAYPNASPYYSYSNPGASYSAPGYASSPGVYPSSSYNYAPMTTANSAYRPEPLAPNSAGIHVVLPDPQATVLFDGRTTSSTGSERFYHSPALAAGGSYQYKLSVSWMQDGHEVTQDKTVAVTPGKITDVVFSSTVSEGVPTVSAAK